MAQTFRERKAERIANGNVQYKFEVWANSYFAHELVKSFKSRKEAEQFAFGQSGIFAGESLAAEEMQRRYPYSLNALALRSHHFEVKRVQV